MDGWEWQVWGCGRGFRRCVCVCVSVVVVIGWRGRKGGMWELSDRIEIGVAAAKATRRWQGAKESTADVRFCNLAERQTAEQSVVEHFVEISHPFLCCAGPTNHMHTTHTHTQSCLSFKLPLSFPFPSSSNPARCVHDSPVSSRIMSCTCI